MKKYFGNIKLVIAFLSWGVLGILFVVLLGTSLRNQGQLNCKDVIVKIDTESGNRFIDETGVKEAVSDYFGASELGLQVKEVNLSDLEDSLALHPYIEEAEGYIDMQGKLHVSVTQKYPIVRVISEKNSSYYISNNGQKIPISRDFTARVPVATGFITDNAKTVGDLETEDVQSVYKLAAYIYQHPFWSAQVEQIYRAKNGDLEIVPKVGSESIILGSTEGLEDKLGKLMTYYQEIVNRVGWNKYKTINLKYSDQIVCKN